MTSALAVPIAATLSLPTDRIITSGPTPTEFGAACQRFLSLDRTLRPIQPLQFMYEDGWFNLQLTGFSASPFPALDQVRLSGVVLNYFGPTALRLAGKAVTVEYDADTREYKLVG